METTYCGRGKKWQKIQPYSILDNVYQIIVMKEIFPCSLLLQAQSANGRIIQHNCYHMGI